MHILAISDIHGNRQALRRILSKAQAADVIVLAGDLTHLGSPDEAREIVALCRAHTPMVLTVTGNCDDEVIEKYMTRDGHSLVGQGCTVQGVGFFGVAAGTPYVGNTWEVSEETMAAWIERGYSMIAAAPHKVLVSHSPPYGLVDWAYSKKHGGSRAVLAALERYAIQLVVCGHIHEARGMTQQHGSTVVNCGPAWMGFYAEIEFADTVQVDLKLLKDDLTRL